jgi:phage tail protein X
MRTYTTRDMPEPLDRIALAEVGAEADLVAMLALNPGLAASGLMVPPRTTIRLPDRADTAVAQPRRLFG